MRKRLVFSCSSLWRLPSSVAVVLLMLVLSGFTFVNLMVSIRDVREVMIKRSSRRAPLNQSRDVFTAEPVFCSHQPSMSTQEQSQVEGGPVRLLSWTMMHVKSSGDTENWFPGGFGTCKQYYGQNWTPCEYTWDRSRLRESDIVLFRGRLISIEKLPKYRSPQQKWLFYDFEPPFKVWELVNLTKVKDMFNLTATYSRDSDIPRINYIKKCHIDPQKAALTSPLVNFGARKRGRVAWFVSVCRSQSARFRYAQELQKYIPVDIYGKCGPKKCGSAVLNTWKTDKCENKLLEGEGSYKFYLAFENSFCEDYITEKLWKLEGVNVIPIVMGMADYASMRPRSTYIDVRDFPSPKALAEYLLHLDQNDELYNQYIRDIRALSCESIMPQAPWYCRLCRYAQENRNKIQRVYDLAKFWGMRRCRRPKEFHTFVTNDDFQIYTKAMPSRVKRSKHL